MRTVRFFFLLSIALSGKLSWGQSQAVFSAKKWESALDRGYALLHDDQAQVAADSCKKWLATPRLPDSLQASILTLNGNALRRLGKCELAISNYEKALALRRKVFGNASEKAADCLHNLAHCYFDLENFAQAARYFETNLGIRKKLYPPGDSRLVLPMQNLADAIFNQNKVEQAEKIFREALVIQMKTGGYRNEITAGLLGDLANCFFSTGLVQQAADTLEQAWAIWQTLPNAPPDEKGRCLQRLGDCLLEAGDLETARIYYQNALRLLEKSPLDVATVLHDLGKLHRYRFDWASAGDYLGDAESACLQAPNTPAWQRLRVAVWLQFSSFYIEQNQPDGAFFYAKEAVREASSLAGQPQLGTVALLKLGACHFAKRQDKEASRCFSEALKRAIASGDADRQFAARQRLGDLAFRQKNFPLALKYYSEAAATLASASKAAPGMLYESIENEAALAKTFKAMAKQGGGDKEWKTVLVHTRQGIRLLESLKGRMRDEASEMDVQEAFVSLFNLAIEATLALRQPGYAEGAFRLAEQYRSQLFVKLAWQNHLNASETSGLMQEERRLRQALEAALKKRHDLGGHSNSWAKSKQLAGLDSLILALSREKSAVEKRLEQASPAWFPSSQTAAFFSPDSVRLRLRQGQTLVEYQWADKQLFVFILRSDTFWVEEFAVPPQLQIDIRRFYLLCHQHPEWQTGNFDDLAELGNRLYRQVLEPIAPKLGNELIIVPDAWLCYLPFDALLTARAVKPHEFWNYPYLVLKNSISYAYSAALFCQLKNSGGAAPGKSLLAFAPVFEGNSRGLKPLRHNLREAAMAGEIFGGKVFAGRQALEESLRSLAADYSILFFATHGVLDDRNAAWSGLAFSALADSLENEFLHAWEVQGLPLRAELVVLSACQTANGKMYRGEGLMSLARAFQVAGAKAVAASLWNVDDEQTPELMASFLSNLAEKMPKSLALADAKRHYLTAGAQGKRMKTHPFFWSGFLVTGDDSPLAVSADAKREWVWWVAGLAVLVGGLLWRLKKVDKG